MSEERNNRQGFFTRMFGEQGAGEGTSVYSRADVGATGPEEREASPHSRAFTVERAAEVIKNLPPRCRARRRSVSSARRSRRPG